VGDCAYHDARNVRNEPHTELIENKSCEYNHTYRIAHDVRGSQLPSKTKPSICRDKEIELVFLPISRNGSKNNISREKELQNVP